MRRFFTPGPTADIGCGRGREAEGADRRDEHGRLYAAFDPDLVLRALASIEILLDEKVGSLSSGKPIRRIVARKQV